MTPQENFKSIAPKYMVQFMADFDATDLDAAAVFGNAGYESLGFTKLQEIKPVVKGSRGGYGWFQWTGPRRVAYENYCKRNGLDPSAHDSNYKWLFVELTTTEKAALPKLKAAKTLETKTKAFENAFERAGVKAYTKRYEWARIAQEALKEYQATTPPEVPVKAPTEAPKPKEEVSTPVPSVKPSFWGILYGIVRALFK